MRPSQVELNFLAKETRPFLLAETNFTPSQCGHLKIFVSNRTKVFRPLGEREPACPLDIWESRHLACSPYPTDLVENPLQLPLSCPSRYFHSHISHPRLF